MAARYSIGLDLGTTNSVMAVVDLKNSDTLYPDVLTVPLRQRLTHDRNGESLRLPSFLYHPNPAEARALPDFSFVAGPWVIGEAAAEMGLNQSGRLVTSAKSWLCHPRSDPRKPLLPWGAVEGVEPISAVEATTRILQHLRHSWEHCPQGAGHPISEQQLTITLPASFDQQARNLTIEACRAAGLGHALLLEEPQAAFYNWISLRHSRWKEDLSQIQVALVIDVGGGTSDFSLIACSSQGESFDLKRLAVGRHLLLGGDNIDITLARTAEASMSSGRQNLSTSQWNLLCQRVRQAKEHLLMEGGEESVTIRLPGSGLRLIGGLRQAVLERNSTCNQVLNRFFPELSASDPPPVEEPAGDMGLPYERIPAITWHILDFLKSHGGLGEFFPNAVLFNGGALEPPAVRQRILDLLRRHSPGGRELNVLEAGSLAEAVARGAAYYGYVRERGGLRIGGGSPHAYYLELQTPSGTQHLCAIPKGTETHERVHLSRDDLKVLTNEPVTFPLVASDQFPQDEAGHVRRIEKAQSCGTLQSEIRFGNRGESRDIPVELCGEISELETLSLQLKSLHTPHTWNLEFSLRPSNPETSPQKETESQDISDPLLRVFDSILCEKKPASFLKRAEGELGCRRDNLPLPALRLAADRLISEAAFTALGAGHESAWLNACGYALRPGFGNAADSGRLSRCWSLLRAGPQNARDRQCRDQWLIFWRRVGPGLGSGRQNDLYQRNKKGLFDRLGQASFKADGVEAWRLMASFEHLEVAEKLRLGQALVEHLLSREKGSEAEISNALWCLGRLGTRQPFHAGPELVVPAKMVGSWLVRLLKASQLEVSSGLNSCILELSRRCGERELELPDELRGQVEIYLNQQTLLSEEQWRPLLETPVTRALQDQIRFLGESLPVGLQLNP